MKRIFEILLPAKIDNTIRGSKIPFYVFVLYAIVSLVRSCIHLLAPDGGAGSIAGMDLLVVGADGIVFAFALWGSSQLILAVMQLLVVFRYRSFVLFMYLMLMLEVLLRELVGKMKPVTFAHIPGRFLHPTGADHWDQVGIVRYRSRRDMLKMAVEVARSGVDIHKWAALEKTQVFPARPLVSLVFVRATVAVLLFAIAVLLYVLLNGIF